MTTAAIRKKLHNYIETAKDKKVKAIFAMVEDDIEEGSVIWTDDFLHQLNKRANEFESGKTKGLTWEEVKKNSRRITKSRTA